MRKPLGSFMASLQTPRATKMSEPKTKQEYFEKATRNSRASGFGIRGTMQHFACPGCAEPDWKVVRIADLAMDDEPFNTPSKCVHCGRTFAVPVKREGNAIQFGFIQTGGPDCSPWVYDFVRREE